MSYFVRPLSLGTWASADHTILGWQRQQCTAVIHSCELYPDQVLLLSCPVLTTSHHCAVGWQLACFGSHLDECLMAQGAGWVVFFLSLGGSEGRRASCSRLWSQPGLALLGNAGTHDCGFH